ncbi:MAG: hypothetical protein AAGC60_08005 [Acidobacteriota bacterium]
MLRDVSAASGPRSDGSLRSVVFLFRLLRRLEAMTSSSAVRIEVGSAGDPATRWQLYAEHGKICWASSLPSQSLLSVRLATMAGLDRDALEELFDRCRRTGRPLGESLVSAGLVTENDLRTALSTHVAVTLGALAHQAVMDGVDAISESPIAEGTTYDPQFTFTGTELLLQAINILPEMTVEIGTLPRHFIEWAPLVRWAACFRLTGHDDPPAVPVVIAGAQSYSLADGLQLYRRALRLAHPPALVASGAAPYAAVVTVDGVGWLLSYTRTFVCLYSVSTQMEVARVLQSLVASERASERRIVGG